MTQDGKERGEKRDRDRERVRKVRFLRRRNLEREILPCMEAVLEMWRCRP